MFAIGRCTAPEAVALSRTLGRDLLPADLRPGYPPAVRFYFRWAELVGLDSARFDGIHPVKVLGALPLEDLLVAAVVHADQASTLIHNARPSVRKRIAPVAAEQPSPQIWATTALAAAEELA